MNVGGPFSGTRKSFMYRLYGGHRSFPRAVLARRGRVERAVEKITRMPHPWYTHYITIFRSGLGTCPISVYFLLFDEQTLFKSSLVRYIFCQTFIYIYIYIHEFFPFLDRIPTTKRVKK